MASVPAGLRHSHCAVPCPLARTGGPRTRPRRAGPLVSLTVVLVGQVLRDVRRRTGRMEAGRAIREQGRVWNRLCLQLCQQRPGAWHRP